MNNNTCTSVKGFSWMVNPVSQEEVTKMMSHVGINEIIARILVGRDVALEKVSSFLKPTLKELLPDPFHFLDMDKAAEFISEAIINKEKIVIFGDYDVDGATSSALLKRFFSSLDADVEIYIPDRIGEGYGPNIDAFTLLNNQGTKLIITVDCGTASFEAIEYAVNNGLKIVVVDHHLSGDTLPAANALVNPNRKDETSKYGYLAAVGVAFLVAVAVTAILRKKGYFISREEPYLIDLLDIVAVGTICDVVPLEDLNRAFVVQGLKIINKRKNLGIVAISKLLNIEDAITTYHLGYVIGPRINAGGRVGNSSLGAKLLSTEDSDEAMEIAQQLESYNAERRAIEFGVFEQALLQANQQSKEDALIMVSSEGWHPGVVGIVAGRLKEIMNKPVAVLSLNGDLAKASCRSVYGVDFGSAIVSAKEEGIISSGGGHKMAAGFTANIKDLPAVKSFLHNKFTKELSLLSDQKIRYFDSYISINAVNLELAKKLETLGPFGPSNSEPRFILTKVYISRAVVFAENHVSCFVRDSDSGNTSGLLKANAFRVMNTDLGSFLLGVKQPINLVGYIKINRWKGRENPEFFIEDAILT